MENFVVLLFIICVAVAADIKNTIPGGVSQSMIEIKATALKLQSLIEKASSKVIATPAIKKETVKETKTLHPGDVSKKRAFVVFVSNGTRDYRVYKEPTLNYEDAFNWCQDRGMRLLTIESEEANKVLAEVLSEEEAEGSYWTSGNDLGFPFSFVWRHSGNPFTYTSFHEDEPTNSYDSERCVSVSKVDDVVLWYDTNCDDELKFVCEKFY